MRKHLGIEIGELITITDEEVARSDAFSCRLPLDQLSNCQTVELSMSSDALVSILYLLVCIAVCTYFSSCSNVFVHGKTRIGCFVSFFVITPLNMITKHLC